MKFDFEATKEYPYMCHCHILEHEDVGMMRQFTVEKILSGINIVSHSTILK